MAYIVVFLLVTAALAAILAFSGEERRSAEAAKFASIACLVLSACFAWVGWGRRGPRGRSR